MVRKVKSSGNCLGIALALIIFVFGVWLCLSIIGAIAGVPLCILALFIGGKRSKVWQCVRCKAVAARG